MIKYLIHVAYEDELYNQDKSETDFNIRNEDKDYFEDYYQAYKTFNKLVDQNELFIQLNKMNTYYLMEFIKVDEEHNKIKILDFRRY